jgi:hypothetical protein
VRLGHVQLRRDEGFGFKKKFPVAQKNG